MNRLGWLLLLVFVAVAVVFTLLLGPVEERPQESTPARIGTGDGDIVIPVAGVQPQQLADTWGDSRGGGTRSHDAIDIMAPHGTPVVAAAPGRIEKLFDSKDGGRTIYIRSPDQRTVYYYAHLDGYRNGLAEGQVVDTGDAIGTVGSTGNASPDAPHLHFEVKRMTAEQPWYEGQAINPYPLLAGKAASR